MYLIHIYVFSVNSQDWIILSDFLWSPGSPVYYLLVGVLPDLGSKDSNMQTWWLPHRHITRLVL
jgi:hypothetical protein